MIKSTAEDYAGYVKIDVAKQLAPVEESIDDMLTRLEEFESMVALVQQERGNAIGLTGTLTLAADQKKELNHLCSKVDVLETLVINVREVLDSLEEQIQTAEEQFGYSEQNAFKNFFITKMFKKVPDAKPNTSKESTLSLNLNEYFSLTEQTDDQ